MADFKKTKKTETFRGLVSVNAKAITPTAYHSGHVAARSAKTGRFAEGVKIVSKRDRAGLINWQTARCLNTTLSHMTM